MNDIEIAYRGSEESVIEWLHKNVQYTRLSASGRSGFDSLDRTVFGVYASKPKVYFRHSEDAVLFALRWS